MARARTVLEALEQGDREGAKRPKALIDDLPLFAAAPPPPPARPASSPVLDLLDDVHPDDLSPKAALELIYRLKDATRG